MPIRVCIDGRIDDEQGAVVSVFDRGFLYGDSVYEVFRTSGGRPVDVERHVDRLQRSAAALVFTPVPRERIFGALADTLAAAGNEESYVRVVITRGAGEFGLDPSLSDRPRLIVIVRPLRLPSPELYRDGATVAIVTTVRNPRRAIDPAVKSGNYLNNILALAEARRAGAYEALMCNALGRLVEGSSSNIFAVRGGVVRTPQLDDGLLDGITRRRVIELADDAGVPIQETHVAPADLLGADEAFLTSSIRGVMPVVRVRDTAIGDGRPGRITRLVADLYGRFLSRVATRGV